ncbi:host attachment protein [Acidithiobacillus ferrianus]|uniref:Host attachment protein n=2 Tax=Acidithiobacillus ferrianus TaxID=2678518 RepID=A0A845U3A8_9PROT|nr:host attachment protein [Acidithiobacillus ferrianus]NDU42112.1 host attachment protein [Acidithiobacillus ferrianus]
MTSTWILVSNAAEARLFLNAGCGKGLQLIHHWVHPDSRKHEGDLVTDSAGRTQQSDAQGERSAIQWKTSPKEAEMQRFAAELAERLEAGRVAGTFQRLILVAPPHFLGLLRESLDAPTSAMVHASLDKDYSQETVPELANQLAKVLCP